VFWSKGCKYFVSYKIYGVSIVQYKTILSNSSTLDVGNEYNLTLLQCLIHHIIANYPIGLILGKYDYRDYLVY